MAGVGARQGGNKVNRPYPQEASTVCGDRLQRCTQLVTQAPEVLQGQGASHQQMICSSEGRGVPRRMTETGRGTWHPPCASMRASQRQPVLLVSSPPCTRGDWGGLPRKREERNQPPFSRSLRCRTASRSLPNQHCQTKRPAPLDISDVISHGLSSPSPREVTIPHHFSRFFPVYQLISFCKPLERCSDECFKELMINVVFRSGLHSVRQ